MPDQSADPWEPLRGELAADVRRVADRLRSMSQTRLAGVPAPPEGQFPTYLGRAQAGRAVATDLAHVARCLEAAAAGKQLPGRRPVPQLSDLAAGDQLAVAGHDLLAALDLLGPGDDVRVSELGHGPAHGAVERSHRLLADLRRRL